LINRLYDAFIKRQQSDEVIKVIVELSEYIDVHFSTEEVYFKRFNYAETTEHIKEHHFFIEKVKEFQTQVKENKGRYVFNIINFLQDWLVNHITVTDKKYIECFKKNGVF
jgi:hemerythrin